MDLKRIRAIGGYGESDPRFWVVKPSRVPGTMLNSLHCQPIQDHVEWKGIERSAQTYVRIRIQRKV